MRKPQRLGHGLSHFNKFSDETSVFGNRIIIWKVDWEGKDPNIGAMFPQPIPMNTTNVKDNLTLDNSSHAEIEIR